MNKTTYLTSLLLAASVCQAGGDQLLAAPSARPAAVKSTKGTTSTKATSSVADVVTAANTFIATLSTSQQTTLLQTFNSTNVAKWSNLPCGSNCRIGLQLSNLTTAQQTAALAVVQAATGTASGEGYNEIQQIRAADDYLNANGGGSGYGSGLYFIAFLGTPSTTGTWMLQFGGHHLATNITFGNGVVTGATPKFEGVEPLSFTTANANIFPTGTTVAPLGSEAAAMLAMISGLTATQKTTAKLSQTFSDVLLGPNTTEGGSTGFPATKVGLQCSTLSSAQQDLVVAAMAPWINDADDATAASLLNYYKTQLANTYIAYSGTGNFTTQADYARIDGPNVWIEFVCQNGVVFQSQIHYHSIWRDRARDYGGNFYTTVLGTRDVTAASVFGVYPSPITAGSSLQLQLMAPATAASYTLRNLLGQTLTAGSFRGSTTAVPTAGLAPGTYLMSVKTPTQQEVTSRVQVY
ncbi:DUF3500 domain-containing protein [Hymenobacter cheonanensis]|uniref:DUF3500 domain-containing protein n=1 Tax=Hymenobacter sp. CA2-7 TaxID=3063993 RepID=UPI002713F675|nr:DUF3500 domain-containing protein [Hymenobacter sp. CA2-7]MDO7885270.1 DUF3500 domain-containing protein [Hymenobacter sp. CA2-7]